MERFVLVHGAWLGGWYWAPLARELESRGHEVWAPELPCEDVSAGVEQYAALIGMQPDAVVVGHSLAGLTLPLVEARAAVFLSALLPVPDVYGEALVPGFQTGHRDDQGRSFWADEASAAERLYPDLERELQRWAFPQLRRQVPLTSHERLPEGPRASIVTLRDVAVRPDWQAAAARDVLGVEPIELDAGHFSMLTHPGVLADLLERSREAVDAVGRLVDLPVLPCRLEERGRVRPPGLGQPAPAAASRGSSSSSGSTLRSS